MYIPKDRGTGPGVQKSFQPRRNPLLIARSGL
jgi:hypothetical protein